MVDQSVIEFLSKLDVNSEGAKVYLALLGKPGQTAQVIAQKTSIPKTTVYRRIEELKKLSLVEEQIDEYKKVFTSTSVDLLNLLVIKKEKEIQELRAQLPNITQLLHGQFHNFDPETKVLFYRGRDGIQQMLWNDLQAKTEVVGYTYRDITNFVGKNFTDTWNEEFKKNGHEARDVYSDEYIKSKFESDKPEEVGWFDWQSRYIPPEILDIQHQMDVYNNVVGIYNWSGDDIFGVEIYNEKVAKLQRQIFEAMWQRGKAYDFKQQKRRFKQIDQAKS